jgi:hypothetical protein
MMKMLAARTGIMIVGMVIVIDAIEIIAMEEEEAEKDDVIVRGIDLNVIEMEGEGVIVEETIMIELPTRGEALRLGTLIETREGKTTAIAGEIVPGTEIVIVTEAMAGIEIGRIIMIVGVGEIVTDHLETVVQDLVHPIDNIVLPLAVPAHLPPLSLFHLLHLPNQ